MLESENAERDQLMEEFENMVDELTRENEQKDVQISKLKMRLADLEHERDRVRSAKEELSRRFMVKVTQRTKKQFTMLEIENEKFENERRAKDQKIVALENQASSLNEKFLILKMDFDEKQVKGQETEGRLKEQLKEISEELVALKKKRNQIFIETLEEESEIRKNSLKEKRDRRKNSKFVFEEPLKDLENQEDNTEKAVSIRVIGCENSESPNQTNKSESSIKEANKPINGNLNSLGFGSCEKFEDQIKFYNQKIYRKRLHRYL